MRKQYLVLAFCIVILCLCAYSHSQAQSSQKLRVLITSSGANDSPRPETVEHFQKRCPEFIVTRERERADYVVVHDSTGAGMGRNPQKIAVFNKVGDAIHASSAKTIKGAVDAACKAIRESAKTRQSLRSFSVMVTAISFPQHRIVQT